VPRQTIKKGRSPIRQGMDATTRFYLNMRYWIQLTETLYISALQPFLLWCTLKRCFDETRAPYLLKHGIL